jgi:hypothetical protein
MPIEAPSGTLDIENAKLRVSEFSATTGVGIGTENTQNYPLYIYKATEPELILQEGSVAAAKFTSNNGSLFIQSGATLSDNSDGDIVFSDMGVNTRHVTVKGATGNVGIGTANPTEIFHVHENISTSGHQIISRVGGSTSSYNTLVFGSKEGRPHIGGHRGDYGLWADLSLQNDLMVLQQGGNVGIGTTSPSYKLNVLTDTNYDGISLRDSTRELLKIAKGNNGAYINMFDSGVSKVNISTSGNSWLNGGNVGIGTTNPAGEFHINGENMYFSSKVVSNCTWRILPQTGNATKLFRIYDEDNAADRLVIDASGNVGIGTVSPELDLHVYGAIITENNGAITPQIQFKSGANNTNGWLMRANVSDSYAGNFTIDRQDNSVTPNKFVIKNNGNVGIGTSNPGAPLAVVSTRNADTWAADKSQLDVLNHNGQGATYGMSFAVSQTRGDGIIQTFNRSSGTAQYDLNLQPNAGNVGIGTTNPIYPLSFTRAGFGVKSAVVNPMSTQGIGAFNFGDLFIGDNVVTECICIYNPTDELNYTFRCGYVQWIQMKIRGTGIQNSIQIIKSYSADSSTVTVTPGGSVNQNTVLIVNSGVADISYTARVFYRALDTP